MLDLLDETAWLHREFTNAIEEVDFQMNRECAEKEELKDELEWCKQEIEDSHHEIRNLMREL